MVPRPRRVRRPEPCRSARDPAKSSGAPLRHRRSGNVRDVLTDYAGWIAVGAIVLVLLLAFAEEQARALRLAEIRLYTNEAMTANLAYYPRHGYTETHRAQEDGFRRVFFAKKLGAEAGTFGP